MLPYFEWRGVGAFRPGRFATIQDQEGRRLCNSRLRELSSSLRTNYGNDTCKSCEPTTSTTSFTLVPDGTYCDLGSCLGGVCEQDCFIDGSAVPSGTLNPDNPCESCQLVRLGPGDTTVIATTEWSPLDIDASCGPGAFCRGSTCVGGDE